MITIDGWIIIGTKLSTGKFDKQITELENKIDSEEKKQELLNNKTKDYESELSNATREVNNLSKEYDNAVKKAEQLQNTLREAEKVKPRTPQIFQFQSAYEEQVKLVDELFEKLDNAENKQSKLRDRVNQTKLQYDNSAKSVDRLRGKIDLITLARQNRDIKTMENGIGNAIKKVGKLALAVLSVRSAYNLLRQASSTWGQYNEQYAKDLEYIRFALASGLAPILEKIVQLVSTLMGYINYLANAWFGRAIFASAKDFEKMQKSAGGISNSVKEIRNNLAGFDELSILSQSTAGGGVGGGFVTPSFDFGNYETEIPGWIKWLGDNGDNIKNILLGIGGAIGAMKISDLAYNLGLLPGKLSAIKAIGIGVGIKGIADGVSDLKEYMDDPSIKNFGKTISDIGESVVGFGIATGNLPVVAGGGMVWLTGKFVENWDEIRDTTQKGIDYLREKSPEVEKIFGETGRKIYDDVLDDSQDILGVVDTSLNSFNNSFHHFIEMLNALRENDWKTAWTKFKNIFSDIWEGIAEAIRTKINVILRFINLFIEKTEAYINKLIDGLNSVGLNISHVSVGRIPLLEKQDVVSLPSKATQLIQNIQSERNIQSSENTSGSGVLDLANSVAERISNFGQEVTVKFEGTMAQFVRELKPHIEVENKRAGSRIITGGAY